MTGSRGVEDSNPRTGEESGDKRKGFRGQAQVVGAGAFISVRRLCGRSAAFFPAASNPPSPGYTLRRNAA